MLILKSKLIKDCVRDGEDLDSSNSMKYLLSIKEAEPEPEPNLELELTQKNIEDKRFFFKNEDIDRNESNDDDIILQRFLSNCLCETILLNDIPNTLDGIFMLENNNAWNEIFERFSGQLKNFDGSSLENLNALKLKSLFKIKKFDVCELFIKSSLKNLDQNDDNFYINVFHWQILRIDMHLFLKNAEEAMHIMHSLPCIIHDKDFYEKKMIIYVKVLIGSKKYKIAIKELVKLLKNLELNNSFKLILYGHLIHLLIYTGLLKSAIYYSNQFYEILYKINAFKKNLTYQYFLLCQALVLFTQDQYECAAVLYHLVISAFSNFDFEKNKDEKYLAMESILRTAVNNFCICCVHLKLINKAVKVFEQYIQSNPQNALSDTVVFNLCTIYDLKSSQLLSSKLKKVVYNITQIYHRNELEFKSFRI